MLAVGEMPAAAAAAGISISRVQAASLLVAGALAGVGGAFLSVGDLGLFTRNMSADRGWIGITAALLALNRPAYVLPAAGLFGFASAASLRLQGLDVPPTVTQFIPQGAAFVALVLVGLRARSRHSLGALWRSSSGIPLGKQRTRAPDAPPAAAPGTTPTALLPATDPATDPPTDPPTDPTARSAVEQRP